MLNLSKIINSSDIYRRWIIATLFSLTLFIFFEVGFLGLTSNPQFGDSSFLVLSRVEQINNNLHTFYPLIVNPEGDNSNPHKLSNQIAALESPQYY